MGTNLTPIIVKQIINLEDLTGKSLAVDANNVLYQFLSLIRTPDGTPLMDSRGNITSHLVGLMFRSTRLIHDYGIHLVFVFDGKPPQLKEREIEKRREVRKKATREYEEAVKVGDYATAWSKAVMTSRLTRPLIDDAKRLLGLLGIPYFQAPSEGEAQTAYMAKKGDVWAANSRDYDSLLFGAPRLVRYVTISGKEFLPSKGVSRPLEPEFIRLENLLSHHKITREQLVDLAILIGTDFNEGIKGIGPKTALRLMKKHGRLEDLPEDLKSQLPTQYEDIRNIFLKPEVAGDYRIEWGELQEEELYEFLCDQRDFSRQRVKTVVQRMKKFYSDKTQVSLGKWVRGSCEGPKMMGSTLFSELANLCRRLEKTTKRKEKTRLISSFLRELKEEEIAPSVYLLVGRVFPEADSRVLEVGGRTVWKILEAGKQATLVQEPLTILRVYKYFEEIAAASGKGSRKKKENLVESLLSQASPIEAEYLVRIMFGEMRIGVVEGMMLEAIAEAARIDLELVRRSYMLLGDLGEIALTALRRGEEGLRHVSVQLFKPIKPMLAEMSYNISEVIASHGGKTAFEYKFDGARIQIHKIDQQVRIFSRRLTDVTDSLPDIVELVKSKIGAKDALLEGEVVAVGADGKPLPFQDLMRRFRRVHKIDEMAKEIPLKLHLFDVVYLDGKSLIDTPYEERWNLLSKICESRLLAERIVTSYVSEAESFLKKAMKAGHEGLMAKALNSNYAPGVRGKKWFKIKPADYLDLVIVAADWGYGRRTGWLSNYHLAARDENTGEFLVVGKTFKGLTDEEFTEMTKRLQEIKISESQYTVHVKPSIVVEIAYNEIQKSPHYKSGFALRFARITRIREDKSPQEADTITRIKQLYEKQFEHKAKITEKSLS